MSIATQPSQLPAIEYPDDVGQPMSENTLQNVWMVTLRGGLSCLFLGEQRKRAEKEHERTGAQAQFAVSERQRAETAVLRAERLAAPLHELDVEPE